MAAVEDDLAYDSRPDTWAHIARVRELLGDAIQDLLRRGDVHDRSKLEDPELAAFNEFTPRLATLEYGTDEYRETLEQMRPALEHHYAANAHHPEHHDEGVRGMSLLDLIEMLCDWKAAGERHESGGDLRRSIELNQQRFGYSDELKDILLATADELGL